MANSVFDFLRTRGRYRVDIAGSFQPNGANTAVTNVNGRGFSVVHTAGTANYVVTLTEPFYGYDGIIVSLQSPTLGQDAQLISEADVLTTKQFTVAVYDSGTKAGITDMAANANTRVHFFARLKNTTVNF